MDALDMENIRYITINDANQAMQTFQFCCNDFEQYYPSFRQWFVKKVLPELGIKRTILTAVDNDDNIAGLCILKNGETEHKICAIRVDEKYRSNGIGNKLLRISLELLNDSKPLITVPEEIIPAISPLLKHADFELANVYNGIYREHMKEYSYNGLILP